MKKLLLLGGTADGRRLATALHHQGVAVIYSVAGLVRLPKVACETLVGGFKPFGGLANYLREQKIDAVLDVTHPYAEKMSATAVAAAAACAIPCWRFHRPPWVPEQGDQWIEYSDWDALLPHLQDKRALFLSVGQLTQSEIDRLGMAVPQKQRQLMRTAVEPKAVLLPSMTWIKAIGPFHEEAERALIARYNIDAIVSKNSGGDSTVAKLKAARALGISVYMQRRPELPEPTALLHGYDECLETVLRSF